MLFPAPRFYANLEKIAILFGSVKEQSTVSLNGIHPYFKNSRSSTREPLGVF
jgi:hypothetical protein